MAHSLVTVPPALDHAFRFSRDIDGFVITVLTSHLKTIPGDRSRLGAWLARAHLTPLDLANEDAAYVAQSLRRLGAEFAARRNGRTDLLEAYLTTALQLTARLSSDGLEGTAAPDENDRRMELLNGLIQRHYRSHKPAGYYASQLGISLTHLNRIVKATTGLGTHQLIARKLIDEAQRELVFSFDSAQKIGYRLGFTDPAYFSRFFLRQVGQTPRSWRLAERGKLGGLSTS